MNRANQATKYQNLFARHFWVSNHILEYRMSILLSAFWYATGIQFPNSLNVRTQQMMRKFFPSLFPYHTNAEKQQEVDVQTFDNQQPTPSSNAQRSRSPRTMSQISGFKRPLMHTNSFTSDRLPVYGVETAHEATLGAMLNDVNTWGIDIFKIGTLSCNRPLTCVAYQIFQV